jgi:hypothetical protein
MKEIKKAVLIIIALVCIWIFITRIVFPITCGLIGLFDTEQEE